MCKENDWGDSSCLVAKARGVQDACTQNDNDDYLHMLTYDSLVGQRRLHVKALPITPFVPLPRDT